MIPIILQHRDELPPVVANELDQLTAALTTAFNQVAASGKWLDVPWSPDFLRNDGAGNSWTTTSVSGDLNHALTYTVIGDTMGLSFDIPNTSLVVTTAVNSVWLKIPNGYAATQNRPHNGKAWILTGGAGLGGLIQTGGVTATADYSTYVSIAKDSFLNFVTDAAFTVRGTIWMEVTKA